MKILVTGSKGFIGKNLISQLKNMGYKDILEFDKDTDESLLYHYTKKCDFVFHLAGINRPQDKKEFMEGNFGFTTKLLNLLKLHKSRAHVLITSSIHAEIDNPYGRSKKAGEDILFTYSKENDVDAYIYRLPNVFGKWSRPNYNSVVATYCYNIARKLEIQINDTDTSLKLCYIDDVIDEFIRALEGNPTFSGKYCTVPVVYNIKLGEIANKIRNFNECRLNLNIPNVEDEFTRKLYSTYLSFLPGDQFSYELKMNCDYRGSFTEFLKTTRGQVSINISKPGVIKGNHWHHTKNEKFMVVGGEGLIKLRMIDSNDVIEYKVSGEKLEVVDIPVGYTHSIKNIGQNDLITIIWANECFNPDKPDTYFLEV